MTGPAAGDGVRDAPASYPVVESVSRYRSGRVIEVRSDRVRMPDGGEADRDVVVHPGAVGVIALDEQERVLLVQQYRHPPQRMLWEPPAGLLDQPGEPPLDAARRELLEETGWRAERWAVLLDAFTSPGMSDEAIRIYLARELTPVEAAERPAGEHEERDMPSCWIPLDEAVRKVLAGDLHNPMAVMGVLAAAHARDDGFVALRDAAAEWPER